MIIPITTVIASTFTTSFISNWNTIIDLVASKSTTLIVGLLAVTGSMAYTIYKQVRLMDNKE